MKAMILDVDGTLWDTTGVVAEAWMQAASELMIPPDTPITADRLNRNSESRWMRSPQTSFRLCQNLSALL